MTSTPASDVSLYELALEIDPALSILQVSPATLKSVFSALMDLLTERELPAIVWAKLPRGVVWQTELERYSTLEGVPKAIYVFKDYRDDSTDSVSADHSSAEVDTCAEATIAPASAAIEMSAVTNTETTDPAWLEILLDSESCLRREYFLFVWTAQFQGSVLAHRPRSAQLAKAPEPNAVEASAALVDLSLAGAIEDSQERRQHLLILSSFDGNLMQRVLSGLEQAKTTMGRSTTVDASISPTMLLQEAVAQWQQTISTMPSTTPDPTSWGQLFMKQIQRQEEVLQRNAIYRRQADLVEILQLQKEELTNALQAKADFINTVGQELRTPLTTIKTALTLLNSPNLKPPQRQRYMDLIAKECDRQSSLITSLLDLVQLDQAVNPAVLQSIRVSDVVPGVVSTYQPLAEEKGVKLVYTAPEDLPAIACMGNWLKQIVINLLHNGIKFTPGGGQVWVRAKQQGNYINLEVRDTGIGMAPGELPKIFDRFYRVRQSSLEDASGAGLGLTIVQQLLLHCGGSISVKSKPGEGSTFTVLLPVRKQQPPSPLP
ncbi:MAG: histidine kinase [Stenomitos rutilans HA7619-LM2]|jgi:signal transduction histidine kinase|nr:histidine kinase [Stenomitos rutilans HA7619-LM2]